MDNNFEYRVYLKSLSKQFPTIADAATEIINLQAILSLPKGTEHFLTDIHGEYEQFNHVLKNGSGSVRRKIDEEFGNTLSVKDKRSLATLIYYPQEKLELVCQEEEDQDVLEDWFKITIHRLVQMTKRVSSKYTRSKVRKALPHDFSYVIEELITEKEEIQDKELYYNEIINTIIRIGRAPECIIALCNLIQRLVIDHLHIVGDIYDRGKGPHVIMDTLSAYHSVDIQWGNHDIVWMGAASGQTACMATVLRISARYGNLDTLEEGYGINLIPLATFALKTYENSDCSVFSIKYGADYDVKDLKLDMMMHKAIAIIQFKLEGQLILAHPEYHMDDRLLLDKIDFEKGTVRIGDKEYEMLDSDFPTVDPKDPYRLTAEEEQVVERLRHAFVHCEKLQKHVRFLFAKGSMYKIFNSNLLYHGCVPVDSNGAFDKLYIDGEFYHGRALLDKCDEKARAAYVDNPYKDDVDFMWFLWGGEKSPLCGRRLKTFEMEYVTDKSMWEEPSNPYYSRYYDKSFCCQILHEFGLYDDDAHIINGHTPVHAIEGENPVRANGKLFVIDGGFCRAMNKKTGIAGYTLIYNSHGLRLKAHTPFTSVEDALINNTDIETSSEVEENDKRRMLVKDTDIGKRLIGEIDDLHKLLENYRRL